VRLFSLCLVLLLSMPWSVEAQQRHGGGGRPDRGMPAARPMPAQGMQPMPQRSQPPERMTPEERQQLRRDISQHGREVYGERRGHPGKAQND